MIDMMKFDMGGAAAVLGAAQTLASLQPPGVQASSSTLSPKSSSSICSCMSCSKAVKSRGKWS